MEQFQRKMQQTNNAIEVIKYIPLLRIMQSLGAEVRHQINLSFVLQVKTLDLKESQFEQEIILSSS